MKIIACTEGRSGQIEPCSLEMIAAARSVAQTSDDVVAFFAGDNQHTAAASLGGADRLVCAIHAGSKLMPAEVYGKLLLDVVNEEKPDLVLVPYSANGLDVAAALSARTGWPLVAYVNAITPKDSALSVTAQLYGGKLRAECDVPLPAILMVNPGAFDEAAASAVSAKNIRTIDATAAANSARVQMVSIDTPDLAEIDLSSAERIVCVGRGIGDAESIELARDLAALLGAEIAGSRPVVDNGWLPKLRQVGKSGQKVAPKLYLALGVSGAPEHLEGMSKSDLIIAINTDAKAPIFNIAHFGATCDLFELMTSLSDRLQARSAT